MADTINTEVTNAPQNTAVSNKETEMAVNTGMEQLSYICEYCGKVNAISSPNCVRCGKRRPRSEYINAMNKARNANSIKSQYIEEQARLAAEQENATQQQLVRLVERRVAEEKAAIVAEQEIKFEQETEAIKRSTARDAVMRIIAAERVAEEKVLNAERLAQEAIEGRNRATAEQIETEREKVLYAAAKKLVSERAGIESAAQDRIEAERRAIERQAQETIETAVDDARKDAARKAILKVIASEQAAGDRVRLERDAIQRAALDRVVEERKLAEARAYSKYAIEKEAIERAVDERIKAEREMLLGKRESATDYYAGNNQPAPTTVQPLAIVPYVNSQQPLYQYNTVKQVYRFVPDEVIEEQQVYVEQPKGKKKEKVSKAKVEATAPVEKSKKSGAVRILALIIALLGVLAILVSVLDVATIARFTADYTSLDVVTAINGGPNALYNSGEGSMGISIASVGAIVLLAGIAFGAASAIIRLFTGRATAMTVVWAVLGLVGAIVLIVGLILLNMLGFDAIGWLIVALVALITLVLACISVGGKGKKEKKVKQPKQAKQAK